MRPLPWLALLALAVGCVTPAPEGERDGGNEAPPDWAERVLSWPPDHDHANASHHAGLTTPNFEIVGYDPLFSAHYGGRTPAGYLCGDAQETTDGRRIAVVESRSDVGFAVADVTDPTAPKWLGELVMPTTYVYDVAVVPDGKHLVLVTSQAQTGSLVPPVRWQAQWRTPCAPQPVPLALAQPDVLPRPASLLLVSIEDPSAPVIIDQRPLPGLGHSVSSTLLDGRRWVLASAIGAPGTDTFSFYELVDTPLGARLSLLSTYAPPAAQDQLGPEVGGHDDGVIAKHPVTQQTLAYLANRRDLTIVDLADPRAPQVVGRWSDWSPEREGFSAMLHSLYPLADVRDGRHYTIIGPEWTAKPRDHPTGIVWVLDTTDPSDITAVAGWTLPHDVEWSERLHFSNHYLSVHGETLFVSMYHAGVWAVDLAPVGSEPFVNLRSVGVFMPNVVSPRPPERYVRWTPTLEEVLAFPDGSLVTFDSNSGLYVFRFDATRPAPSPEPWPIVPPKGGSGGLAPQRP
ncbi:MAG TPA: hypothetical protein VM582_07315 [Candidatus Thermoplasmatota archaeon]|nr:hypothetical protein [Candidatus Thermoplasmatota archaeon]